jgi:hypothetical protein
LNISSTGGFRGSLADALHELRKVRPDNRRKTLADRRNPTSLSSVIENAGVVSHLAKRAIKETRWLDWSIKNLKSKTSVSRSASTQSRKAKLQLQHSLPQRYADLFDLSRFSHSRPEGGLEEGFPDANCS